VSRVRLQRGDEVLWDVEAVLQVLQLHSITLQEGSNRSQLPACRGSTDPCASERCAVSVGDRGDVHDRGVGRITFGACLVRDSRGLTTEAHRASQRAVVGLMAESLGPPDDPALPFDHPHDGGAGVRRREGTHAEALQARRTVASLRITRRGSTART
jgi:hypothetical protein